MDNDISRSVVHRDMHDMLYRDTARLSRSASVAAISDPHRHNVTFHPPRSQSPQLSSSRAESPARRLSRSETFTCSIPRKSQSCMNIHESHITTRCDSPQTRSLRRQDSFPPPRSESPSSVTSDNSVKSSSPRRHSIQVTDRSPRASNIQTEERSRRHSDQVTVDQSAESEVRTRHHPVRHAGARDSHGCLRRHSMHVDRNKDGGQTSRPHHIATRPRSHADNVSDVKFSVVHERDCDREAVCKTSDSLLHEVKSDVVPRPMAVRVSRLVSRHASVAGDASTATQQHAPRTKPAWLDSTCTHDSDSDQEVKYRSELRIDQTKKVNQTDISVQNQKEASDSPNTLQQHVTDTDNKHVTNMRNPVSHLQESHSADDILDGSKSAAQSKVGIVRARSRPEINSSMKSRRMLIREEEEKIFRKIESVRKGERSQSAVTRSESQRVRPASVAGITRSVDRERPATELDFNRQSAIRANIIRARSGQRAPVIARHNMQTSLKESDTDHQANENKKIEDSKPTDQDESPKRNVKLSRQSAIRTERSDIRLKIPAKPVSESDDDSKPKDSRLRRIGVVTRDARDLNDGSSVSKTESQNSKTDPASDSNSSRCESPDRVCSTAQLEVRPLRRVTRSSSEVRPRSEVIGVKVTAGGHFGNTDHHSDQQQHVIIPPPEFRDSEHSKGNHDDAEDTYLDLDLGEIPETIKTSKAEFKVSDLLHVSWACDSSPEDVETNPLSTSFRIPLPVSSRLYTTL